MNNKISCVIVDDDRYAIDVLKDYISEIPNLELRQVYTKPIEALAEINVGESLDLLFLDIDMPGISGIQFAKNIKSKPNIIFTTAHAKYAIEAFDVQAKHFLLKPIELSKFVEVVTSVISSIVPSPIPDDPKAPMYIRTGQRGKLTKLLKQEVIYVQAAMNYVDLITKNKTYTIYMTMKEMEDILKNDKRFYRVHKSYIINTDFVQGITGNVVDLGSHKIDMSSQFKTEFMHYLNQNTLISKRI